MRLLIADDDDYTREGLAEMIEWEKFGIKEILLAEDGMEALRLTMLNQPEIVLTDIRMPKLNGIEFAEKLAEKSPDSLLLFMSGFMEVDYLRSAITLSAVEYIEKPIKLPDVEQAIRKAVRCLEVKRDQQAVETRKNELAKRRLAGMVKDEEADSNAILSLCLETGFPSDQHYLGMLAWQVSDNIDSSADLDILLQYWREYEFPAIGEQLERERCFVTIACSRSMEKRWMYLIEAFLDKHPSYCLAIGAISLRIQDLPHSYQSACRAMERSFYHGELRCFREAARSELPNGSFARLLPEFYKLAEDRPREVPDWIQHACRQFRESEPEKAKVFALLESVLLGMIGAMPTLRQVFEEKFGAKDAQTILRECSTLDCMESRLAIISTAWLNELDRSSGYSRLVQDVINYIALNYPNIDLSLTMIGKQMHMSSAHLGVLFKQETGTTIKQYISDWRLEAAKKLVVREHLKMNEIAEMCGYASASYFAKVFKASTDMSPIEFRHQRKQLAP